MKVVHVISGLIGGGTETTLWRLLGAARFEAEVVSLTGFGTLAERIRALGVPVTALEMGGLVSNLTAVARLARWLRRSRPDVVQTWLYHADLVGGLAARIGTGAPVLWNLRHSEFVPGIDKRTTLWTVRACAALSRVVPTRILCCSHASRLTHARLGYPLDAMVVIPNGFDLRAFHPDGAARAAVREELGIGADDVVIGVIGNYRREKDFPNFLAAARRVADRSSARFLLCGADLEPNNRELVELIRAHGLADRVTLLGRRSDVSRVAAALDIGCSSSVSEGLPNAIGEAMACGVPCVVTDVGDCAYLVGKAGRVVARRDPVALASALLELVDAGPARRRELGAAARRHITAQFGFQTFVERYHEIYEQVREGAAGRSSVDLAGSGPARRRRGSLGSSR